ncbi:MAG: hypothetical protein ACYTXY_45015, partial [Nostoc sp.]
MSSFHILELKEVEQIIEDYRRKPGHSTELETELTICDYRQLEYLPESIGNLTSLTALSICDCWRLKELPETIGKLKNLKKLHIWG